MFIQWSVSVKNVITILAFLFCTAQVWAEVPQKAADVNPIEVGAVLPSLPLLNSEGEKVSLKKMVQDAPSVIIFYRGGWCPYCNKHLGALQTVSLDLLGLGYQIIAISPDRPEKLKEASQKNKLEYTLLSDSSMEYSRAMGLAFRLDDETFKKYKNEYKIDIEADSGQKHHQLPVPAAFIADGRGVIKYAYSDPDYKKRIDAKELAAKARELHVNGET